MEQYKEHTYKESPTSYEQQGVAELKQLLKNPMFQKGFIEVQTASQQNQLSAVYKEMDRAVEQSIKPLIEAQAATALGVTSIEEGRKYGKKWGEALRSVSEIEINLENGEKRKMSLEEARRFFSSNIAKKFEPQLLEAQEALSNAEKAEKERLASLEAELEKRKNDPQLLDAMGVWGRSPDSSGDLGTNDQGYHAGVIHYFEYRANAEKNGRYKNIEDKISIDGFIAFSNRLKSFLDNPNPQNNAEVRKGTIIGDEQGNRRLYVLTNKGEFIVGFQNAQNQEPMRVVTIIPGRSDKDYANAVSAELEGRNERNRLNRLQGKRDIIT